MAANRGAGVGNEPFYPMRTVRCDGIGLAKSGAIDAGMQNDMV
jgi:hypothetical protein